MFGLVTSLIPLVPIESWFLGEKEAVPHKLCVTTRGRRQRVGHDSSFLPHKRLSQKITSSSFVRPVHYLIMSMLSVFSY